MRRMISICGLLEFAGQSRPDLIGPVMKHLRRKGAKQAKWSDGTVTLGWLTTSMPDGDKCQSMPWRHAESGLVITADARLDNREEILRKLCPADAPGKHLSDGELLLFCYLKWGSSCTQHLLGEFAFVIWDPVAGRLFCVRDPMGGRSLCFVRDKERFSFASEPEALLQLPGVSGRPNEQRIAEYLAPELSRPSDRRSWQLDVKALMPGEHMTVELGGRERTTAYYRLTPRADPDYGSYGEFLEHFQEVFGKAVNCRLGTTVNSAIMMSGGLDSAAIIAASLRQRGELGVDTFSVIEDRGDPGMESQSILQLAGLSGVRRHLLDMSDLAGNASALMDVAWSKAHPVDNSLLIPALLFQLADRCGHDAVLHGASGDVALAAPRYYPEALLRRFCLRRAWRECRLAGKNNVYLLGKSRGDLLLRSAYVATIPERWRRWLRHRRQGLFSDGLINPRFADQIRAQLAERGETVKSWGPENPKLIADLVMSGNGGFGRVARRFGMTASDPWADRRVVEFFFGLPVEYKIRDGWTKYPVRASFDGELPARVLWRRDKEHFGWKVTESLLAGSLEFVETMFRDEFFRVERYVDESRAKAALRKFRESGNVSLAQQLLEAMSLIIWLKRVDSGRSAVD